MAKQIANMHIHLEPNAATDPEALDDVSVWYEIEDSVDTSLKKRDSYVYTSWAGTDTLTALYAAVVADIKTREGIT